VSNRTLRLLFQHVLATCLAAPSLVGCGGNDAGVSTPPNHTRDGGPTGGDAGPGPDGGNCAPVECGGCGPVCGPGCIIVTTCPNGVSQSSCDCNTGMDAGLSCNPDRTSCQFYLPLDCLDAAVPDASTMAIPPAECRSLCGSPTANACYTVEAAGGSTVLACACGIATGRRPRGFRVGRAPRRASEVGRYLATAARLEAASVDAFRILRDELVEHGAPSSLVEQAERAARDEVKHARVMGALARRHGATARRTPKARRTVRSIEAIALENAVEGCVRETFGALTATFQASRAADPRIRAAMKRIAIDETRHASLGWAVAKWAEGRLAPQARARVEAARTAAVAELASELQHDPSQGLRDTAGLPDARQAAQMVNALARTVWSPRAERNA
jgi:hypothetical protein